MTRTVRVLIIEGSAVTRRILTAILAADGEIEVVERLVGFLALGGDLFLGHSESLLGMSTGLRLAGKTVYHKVRGGPPR